MNLLHLPMLLEVKIYFFLCIVCILVQMDYATIRMKFHLCFMLLHSKVFSNMSILQRLRLIEIFDVKRLQMRYATSLIGWVPKPKFLLIVPWTYC